MKVPLCNMARIVRSGLLVGLLVGLLALALGADAGAASRSGGSHRGNNSMTFRLFASPRRQRIHAGSTARYAIRIARKHFTAAVSFRVTTRLPRGLRVRLSPRSTRGRRVALVIRTSWYVRARRYRVRVRASGRGVSRILTLTLTIARPASATTAVAGSPAPYSISGDAAGPLEPGMPQPLDLQITNPNSTPLTVSSLTVTLGTIDAPRATVSLPCSAGDFSVQQYSGPQPLLIPGSSTRSLADLGVSPAAWPQISLLDLPADQDGCQGASVTLSYVASATTG